MSDIQNVVAIFCCCCNLGGLFWQISISKIVGLTQKSLFTTLPWPMGISKHCCFRSLWRIYWSTECKVGICIYIFACHMQNGEESICFSEYPQGKADFYLEVTHGFLPPQAPPHQTQNYYDEIYVQPLCLIIYFFKK